MVKPPEKYADTPKAREGALSRLMLSQDALSAVLDAVRVRGQTVFLSQPKQNFSISFPDGMRTVHIVEQGSVSVQLTSVEAPIVLNQGDLILLAHGKSHTFSDHSGQPHKALADVVTETFDDENRILGTGETTRWLTGTYTFDQVLGRRLLEVLPPAIVLRGQLGRPLNWLDQSIRFILLEAQNHEPGNVVMISRLLDLILIRVLRTWASSDEAGPGWLRGAMDKQIGKVLTAIHTRPEDPWTVRELAELAFMSRSTFAARFQQLVGHSPADYVTTCKMDRAMDLLRLGDTPVYDIAERVGYQSPASFTRAFQKRVNLTPNQWRQKHRADNEGEIVLASGDA